MMCALSNLVSKHDYEGCQSCKGETKPKQRRWQQGPGLAAVASNSPIVHSPTDLGDEV